MTRPTKSASPFQGRTADYSRPFPDPLLVGRLHSLARGFRIPCGLVSFVARSVSLQRLPTMLERHAV